MRARWLEFEGTSVGAAADGRPRERRGAAGVRTRLDEISGLNLRLYEPAEQRWSATFASLRDGLLTPSVCGRFRDGVGEFHGDDELAGRPISVRFVIERQGPRPGDVHPGLLATTTARPGRPTGSLSTERTGA